MAELKALLAEQNKTHARAARCAVSVGVHRCALPAGHLYDHTITPALDTFVIGPSVVLVPTNAPHVAATASGVPASLTEIVDGFAQLVNDGVPEPIALLTVARRAIDAASARLATSKHPTVRELYHRLGSVSRDLVVLRDGVDDALQNPAPIVHAPTKSRRAKKGA